jgi:hypothetical protein
LKEVEERKRCKQKAKTTEEVGPGDLGISQPEGELFFKQRSLEERNSPCLTRKTRLRHSLKQMKKYKKNQMKRESPQLRGRADQDWPNGRSKQGAEDRIGGQEGTPPALRIQSDLGLGIRDLQESSMKKRGHSHNKVFLGPSCVYKKLHQCKQQMVYMFSAKILNIWRYTVQNSKKNDFTTSELKP